ncbi:hypothetical protein NRS6120_13330 [Bacillus subtilis]|nr:hypothetical protein NRS6120_00206 [Bacillus subtilis]CAI6285703.1 hypothetical protein NRS6120_13330 [Bacillus subtilis]
MSYIYFFSLDADHRLAALGARTFFHLPYFYADMKAEKNGDGIDYVSKRKDDKEAAFHAAYRPISAPFTAEKDSLDYWLTERYRLYTILPIKTNSITKTSIIIHGCCKTLKRKFQSIR